NLLGGNLVSDAGGAEVLAYSEFPHGQLVLYLSFHLSQVIHLSLNRLSLGGPQEVVELEFLRGLRLDCLVDLLKGNALVPSFNVELPEVPRSLESLGFELRIRQFGAREDQAGPEPRGSMVISDRHLARGAIFPKPLPFLRRVDDSRHPRA